MRTIQDNDPVLKVTTTQSNYIAKLTTRLTPEINIKTETLTEGKLIPVILRRIRWGTYILDEVTLNPC